MESLNDPSTGQDPVRFRTRLKSSMMQNVSAVEIRLLGTLCVVMAVSQASSELPICN